MSLVKLLAITPGHALHREQILDTLWPDEPPVSALNHFRKALHAARRALEPGLEPYQASSFLSLANATLTLRSDDIRIDVERFEALVALALKCMERHAFHDAIESYGGPLLPGDRYVSWVQEPRERLAERYVQVLLGAANVREQAGQPHEAIKYLHEVLLLDPVREEAHRSLMRLHALLGDRVQALRQYRLCCDVLQAELDVAPDAQTDALYRQIKADSEGQGPATAGDVIHATFLAGLAEAAAKLGAALTTAARYGEALEELDKAVELFRALGDLERLSLTTAAIARVFFLQSQPQAGIDRLSPLLARQGLKPAARASLLGALAPLYWLAGRFREQLQATELSERLALAAGADKVRAEAAVWRGVALLALENEGSIEALEAAAKLAEGVGDFVSVSRALSTIGVAYYERGEFDRQESYLERAVTAAERSGDPGRIAFMLHTHGCHAWMVGTWDVARRDFERAVAVSDSLGQCLVRPYALLGLAWISLATRDWDAARARAIESLSEAKHGGDSRAIWAAHGLLGEVELRSGHPRAAQKQIRQALQGDGLNDADRILFDMLLAQACLALGEVDEAADLVAGAEARSHCSGSKPAIFEMLYVRGLLTIQRNQLEDAEESLDKAIALAHVMRSPHLEARALEASAEVQSRRGNHRRAEEHRHQAEIIFRRLGVRDEAGPPARLPVAS